MKKIIFNLLLIAGIGFVAPRVQAMSVATAIKNLPITQIPLALAASAGIAWTISTGCNLVHELGHAIPAQLLNKKKIEGYKKEGICDGLQVCTGAAGKTIFTTPALGIIPSIAVKSIPLGGGFGMSPEKNLIDPLQKAQLIKKFKNIEIIAILGPLSGIAASLAISYGLTKIETVKPLASILLGTAQATALLNTVTHAITLLPLVEGNDGCEVAEKLKLSSSTCTFINVAVSSLAIGCLGYKLASYL